MGNRQSRRERPQESSGSRRWVAFWKRSSAAPTTQTRAVPLQSDSSDLSRNSARNTDTNTVEHHGELREGSGGPPQLGDTPHSRETVHSAVPLVLSNVTRISDILKEAGFHASEWESLASRLGIGDPGSIRDAHPRHPALCLQETIRQWLHNERAVSWKKLATEVSKVNGYGAGTKQTVLLLAGEPTENVDAPPSSAAVARYADYLTACYNRAAIAPETLECPKWPPTPSKKYINLALVKKEQVSRAEADSFTKETLHGNVDEILKKKERIHLEDVFKPEKGQASLKCILVEGAPGAGKSTFAWELCRRKNEIEAMRQFSLVVLLRLREKRVQEARTVADLFYHDDSRLQEAVAQEVVASEGSNILLILDGFDEYPAHLRNNSLIARIIQGTSLPKCTVLVTSRPSARTDLLSVVSTQVHKHIEVLGFTHEEIKQYAKSVFASNKPLHSDFLTYISANPAIRGAMYIPLNSAIVVELYRENKVAGRPIPQTMTQLYTDLSFTLLRRYLSGKGDQRSNCLPEKLEELPQDLYNQLLTLARLAFEGIVKQEVIFASLPEGCTHFGFMNAEGELYLGSRGTMSYNFLHLTLQEYLGAFYFSTLPVDEQVGVFEHYSDKEQYSHMDVVWRFVAGLTRFRGIGWEVVRARRGRNEYGFVIPFLVQCLYEAQDEVACESVLGRGDVTLSGQSCLSTFDCFAVGYCVAASRCGWRLLLGQNNLEAEMVEMLVCGLKSKAEVGGCIRRLYLSRSPIKQEGVAHLQKMPQEVLQQIGVLNISLCELDGTALDLLSEIIPTMTSLQEINIGHNPAGAGGTVRLLRALSKLSSLRSLDMAHTSIGSDDVRALSQLIRPSGSLRVLRIGDSNMPVQYVELLTSTTLVPSSLEKLMIWWLDLTSCSTSFLLLEENHNLTELHMVMCKIGCHGTSCLAKALHKNTALKKLQFDMDSVPTSDQIGTEGAMALSEMLTVNHSLEELEIEDDNSLGQDGVRALISSLQDNHTLRTLELPKLYRDHFSSNHLDSRVVWC